MAAHNPEPRKPTSKLGKERIAFNASASFEAQDTTITLHGMSSEQIAMLDAMWAMNADELLIWRADLDPESLRASYVLQDMVMYEMLDSSLVANPHLARMNMCEVISRIQASFKERRQNGSV